MKKFNLLILCLLLVLPFTIGCAIQSQERFSQDNTLYSEDSEYLSTIFTLEFRKQFRLETTPEAWHVVTDILYKLQKSLDKIEHKREKFKRYQAVILDTPLINAFALPDGKMYVTSGLLNFTRTEDELAGVIGHEMAHVELNHYRINTSVILNPLSHQFLELEADQFGLKLARTAGYSAIGVKQFYEDLIVLENITGKSTGGGLFSTHPSPEGRITQLNKLIADEKINQNLKDSSPAYGAMKKRYFDDDNAYSPQFSLPHEPAMLDFPNSNIATQYKKAHDFIKYGYDHHIAGKILLNLVGQVNSEHLKNAIYISIIQMNLMNGNYKAAEANLKNLDDNSETKKWLSIIGLWTKGEQSDAKNLWSDLTDEDTGCEKNKTCTLWGLYIGNLINVDTDKLGEFARRYQNYLAKRLATSGVTKNEATSLSKAISYEMLADLNENPKKLHEIKLPNNMRTSAEQKDLTLISEYLEKENRTLGYVQDGITIGMDSGFHSFTGQFKKIFESMKTITFQVGYRRWPWEYGGFYNLAGANDKRIQGLSGPRHLQANNFGVYLHRDFTSTDIRPWAQLQLGWGTLSEKSTLSGSKFTHLSHGPLTRLVLGGGWHMTFGIFDISATQLYISSGLTYLHFQNFADTSGKALAYDFSFGLTVRFGSTYEQDRFRWKRPEPKKPAMFY